MEGMAIKKILITGGLGYLGGRICKNLSNFGFNITIVTSRKDAYLPEALKDCSLAYVDFDSYNCFFEVCKGINYVIHLASLNAQSSELNPSKAINVNVSATSKLIQASIVNKVEGFIYFSTAHVYGSPLSGNVNEGSTVNPLHPYAYTHKQAEDQLFSAVKEKKISGVVLRLSNMVGPPLTTKANCWILLLNDVCKQAVTKQSITIYGNPYEQRDYLSIDVLNKILIKFLSIDLLKSSNIDCVYNVGSGRSYSVSNIVDMVSNRCKFLFGFNPKIIYKREPIKVKLFNYNVSKIKLALNLQVNRREDLRDSIDEVLLFCKENFNESS
jgi:UDP-glucose 4-epimerase